MKKRLKALADKRRKKSEVVSTEPVPRITNTTVAEHREEVLGGARKYIYPIGHSKHRIVVISSAIFIATVLAFFAYVLVSLYRFKSTSTFMYRVTQVLPLPIARVEGDFVAYENYLFELRRFIHYYETQLKTDFNDPKNFQQLDDFKRRALARVVDEVYTNKLAERYNITVTEAEVNSQLDLLREQNRIGNGEKVLEDVLSDFWGWTLNDFKRELKRELLAQKLVATLDGDTKSRAEKALTELRNGATFSDVAKKYSEDANSKNNGGEYGFPIEKDTRSISPSTAAELQKLKANEYSGIIQDGYTLQIVKVLEKNGDKVRAAHIQFNFKPLDTYVNEQKEQKPATQYINL
jgi:uncharacterized protein YkwD